LDVIAYLNMNKWSGTYTYKTYNMWIVPTCVCMYKKIKFVFIYFMYRVSLEHLRNLT